MIICYLSRKQEYWETQNLALPNILLTLSVRGNRHLFAVRKSPAAFYTTLLGGGMKKKWS